MIRTTKTTVRRVLLVDEHPMVRTPLATLIDAEIDFAVCGQARSRKDALDVTRMTSPDLAVVGLKLHGSHGLDLIKDIHRQHSDVAVIVLSAFEVDYWAERSLRAGARGFVSKAQQPAELLAAMRLVLAGQLYASAPAVRRLVKSRSGPRGSIARLEDLPDREYQVLWYIGHGYAVREVAEHLRVSVPTVETYRARLKEKLGCADHMDLLKIAIQWAHSGQTT